MISRNLRKCHLPRLLVVAGVLGLAACASTPEQNDPSEGGFFRAVQGVSGGQYEARRQAREAELAAEERQGQRLDDRLAQLEAEQAELDRQIAMAKEDLEAVDQDIEQALSQLEALGKSNSKLERDFQQAQLRLAELRHSLTDERYYSNAEIQQIAASIQEIEQLVLTLTAQL